MKPVMNSQEINEMFLNAKNDCDKLIADSNNRYKTMAEKVKIINYANDFISFKLDIINSGINKNNMKISFDNNVEGIYDQYGYVIHPKIKSSLDIFNLKLLSSNETIGRTMFRKAVNCKVNDIEDERYINLLMEDNVPEKEIVFDELKEDTIKIEYELDNQLLLGTSRFNMIEIDPYISGSIDIVSIEFYDLNINGELSSVPIKTINKIDSIGKTRIILDKKIKFSKAVFTFKCNYSTTVNNTTIYPFGIKHILFKEVDFISNSSAIIEIIDDNFIEYFYNDIVLYTTLGKIETNLDMYGIEVYTDFNNALTGRVYPSTNADVNRISKNTKKLFIKIPLINVKIDEKEYLSLTGIKINYTTQEEIIL